MTKPYLAKAALAATAALGLVVLFAGPARAEEFAISGAFDPGAFYSGPLNGGSFHGTYETSSLPLAAGNIVALTAWDIFLVTPSATVYELTSAEAGAFGVIDTQADPSHTILDIEDNAFHSSGTGNFLELQFAAGFDGNGAIIPFTSICPGGIDCSFAGIGGNTDRTDSSIISGQSAAVPEPSSVVMLSLMLCGLVAGAKRFALHRS